MSNDGDRELWRHLLALHRAVDLLLEVTDAQVAREVAALGSASEPVAEALKHQRQNLRRMRQGLEQLAQEQAANGRG